MTRTDEAQGRPRRGSAEKHRAIVNAARAVFGRVGYLGSSIDLIASEAGVSTRTIYNHFESKEQLFASVLTESSQQVAAAHEDIIERHLTDVTDAEAELTAFAREWIRPQPEFEDHFAIVRRINAEGEYFPQKLYEAWQEAGPLRVRRSLAARLADLAGRGLLRAGDAEVAAQHLAALLSGMVATRVQAARKPLTESETDEIAATGVHAFLYGYLPRA